MGRLEVEVPLWRLSKPSIQLTDTGSLATAWQHDGEQQTRERIYRRKNGQGTGWTWWERE